MSKPVTRTVPLVGRSRVPIRCSSVVLPEPDGPTMPTSSPRRTVKLTPRSASTGGSRRVGLGHRVQFEHYRPVVAAGEAVRCGRRGWPRVGAGRWGGHTLGTTTCWPAKIPGPLTWTSPSASSKRPRVTPDEVVHAAGPDRFNCVAPTCEGEERVHRYDQDVVRRTFGNPDLDRELVERARGGRVRSGRYRR